MPAAALSYFMNQIITNGMYRVTIDQKPDQGRRLAIDRHIDATLADADVADPTQRGAAAAQPGCRVARYGWRE